MADLPSPPVPPNCDLTGFPFIPLDCVRLIQSDFFACSTGEEFKAAVTLWCKSWANVPAGSLSKNPKVISNYLGISEKKLEKIKKYALHGWYECSDNLLYHPVISEKALEAFKSRKSLSARAVRANEVRWGSRQKSIPEGSNKDPTGIQQGSNGESLFIARDRDRDRDREKTPITPIDDLFSGPPSNEQKTEPQNDETLWRYEGHLWPWAREIKKVTSKIGPRNWMAWKNLHDGLFKGDTNALVKFTESISADNRWPDYVEKEYSKRRPDAVAEKNGRKVHIL